MSGEAIYARQSVEEDELASNQVRLCQRTAKDYGIGNIPDSLIFEDVNVSASKPRDSSTGWGRMLIAIKSGDVRTVIITDTDRLMRGVQDAQSLVELGVRVITLDGSIDTRTADGERRLLNDAVSARFEVRRKSERAVRAAALRHDAGHPTSGTVAYGYRWMYKQERDALGTRLTIVETEAAALRFMSREFLGGSSLGEVVKALNEGTARDERGRELHESTRRTRPRLAPDSTVKRPGVKWTTTTLRRVLLSPYSAALLPPTTPKGKHYQADNFTLSECTPGTWDEILTEDAVAAARGRLLDPSRRTHDGDTRAKWLLSGLGECGRCGGPLRKCQTKTTATSVRGYRCTTGCFQRPAALIEEYVEKAAVEVLSAPGLLTWVDDGRHDIGALRARRDAIDADETEWFARVQSGMLRPAQWDVLSARWSEERAQLDRDIAEAVSVDPAAAFVGAEDVRALWDGLSTARKRAVLGALLHGVQVHPVGKGKRVRTVEEIEGTVTMRWKRAERRVRIDPDRTVSSVRGRVPDDSRDAIVRALDG